MELSSGRLATISSLATIIGQAILELILLLVLVRLSGLPMLVWSPLAQGGWNGGYGNVVMIDHGNGYITVYGHLSQINVVPCQGVSAGQLIGLAGSTGNSTGATPAF